MANEVLAVKLRELDESMATLHRRLQSCEAEELAVLEQKIQTLAEECRNTDLQLMQELEHSKPSTVRYLAQAYDQIEETIRLTTQAMQESPEADAEKKIVFAEYSLDFAMQAANHALLHSLEAVAAQKRLLEEERSPQ